jgi:hypothetical protein
MLVCQNICQDKFEAADGHVPLPVSMLCHRTVNGVLMISAAGSL